MSEEDLTVWLAVKTFLLCIGLGAACFHLLLLYFPPSDDDHDDYL